MVYIRVVRLKSLKCWKGWSVHDMADVFFQLLDMKDGLTHLLFEASILDPQLLHVSLSYMCNSLLNLTDMTDFMGSLHPLLCCNSSPEFFIFHIVPNRKR